MGGIAQMRRFLIFTLIILIVSVLTTTCIITSIDANGRTQVALHTEKEYTLGDPVVVRAVSREHESKDQYSQAYAYGVVGEILGLAADWYSYAYVNCEPSNANHESSYSLKVEILRGGWFGGLQFKREKSKKSIHGDVTEFEIHASYTTAR